MGFGELEPYFLAVQFVLQWLILMVLVSSAARREGEFEIRKWILQTLAICLGTVLIESWLAHEVAWLILLPALGLTALVLINASWTAMWSSCTVVIIFCGLFIGLTLDFREARRQKAIVQAEEEAARQQKAADPIRYQQIATSLSELPGKKKIREPQPENPVTGTTTTQVAVLEDALEIEPEPVVPLVTTNWVAARESLEFGGRAVSGDATNVAYNNHQLKQVGDVVIATHDEFKYIWLVKGIDRNRATLEPLRVEPIQTSSYLSGSDQ